MQREKGVLVGKPYPHRAHTANAYQEAKEHFSFLIHNVC